MQKEMKSLGDHSRVFVFFCFAYLHHNCDKKNKERQKEKHYVIP